MMLSFWLVGDEPNGSDLARSRSRSILAMRS